MCHIYIIDISIYKLYIYIYIYIYIKDHFSIKSVIFPILRIFNGLLQTKRVKKYIITE